MAPKTLLFALAFFCSNILCYAPSSNVTRVAGASKAHYKELTLLDRKPNRAYAWMDTITYPRKEVATSTLAVTMWRTAYLIEDVPELLAIEPPPANSSDQTRRELEIVLKLQSTRTDKDISRYRTLAGIYHSPNNINTLDPDYDR